MKKSQLFLTAFLCAFSLAGCGQKAAETTTAAAVESGTEASETGAAASETGTEAASETGTEAVSEPESGAGEAEEAGYPVTLTIYDSEGKAYEETWEQAPERVVTTTTSAAELLIALGLEDRIVGIITPDNAVPEELQPYFDGFNNLGDKKTLSKEVIVSAEPQLVIGRVENFHDETSIDRYQELGILSYTQLAGNSSVTTSPEALVTDIRNLGKIFGVEENANDFAAGLEARLKAVEEKAASIDREEPMRSLFMVSFNDGVFGVMNGQLQDEIMSMLGCEDVADKGQSGLSYENLIQYNPDVIIYISADRNAATDAGAVETLLAEPLLQSVPAIANQKILTVKYDCIMDVGPRLVDTIEELADALYEDR